MAFHARLIIPALALLTQVHTGNCQTLYIDSNGDGLNWILELQNGHVDLPVDCVTEQTSSIDVYLATDKNPDGSAAPCAGSAQPMTINSYQVILRLDAWAGGHVVANGWTDAMGYTTPNITMGDGSFYASGTDVWVGRTGESKPGGTYKLGTLSITAAGSSTIYMATSTAIAGDAVTGFGSACSGSYEPGLLLLGGDFPAANAFSTCYPDPVLPTTWGKIKQRYR